MTDADTIRQALDATLICSGSWGHGADPSLCRDCAARARAALVILDRLEARLAAAEQTIEQREIGYRAQIERAEAAEAALDAATQALRKIAENAESWHGPPPDNGHVRALGVIGDIARAALAAAAPEEPT